MIHLLFIESNKENNDLFVIKSVFFRFAINLGIQTWSDTSIRVTPIHRVDPSFTKLNNSSFIIFGGATEYLEELLLNDLWKFDICNSIFLIYEIKIQY
jgi:hypothetical protein